MFDELKILITGDTSGIEGAIKQSINIVQGGVKAMNAQEVDWTGIFSRAVSPAIISSVASVFAFAIQQSLSFSTAMAQTGTAAGESTAQIAQMSSAANQLSTTVPASAQDIANSMAQVGAIFSNVNDQQSVVAAMAQLAASGFGNLNDITSASIDLFRQFGVTTTSQAINVLTSLMHAAEGAKETIPALADQFTSFSSQLPQADRSVSSFNDLISAFAGEVQAVGASGAAQVFAALAQSSSSAVGPMEKLGISFAAIQSSLVTDGGATAIKETAEALAKYGANSIVPQALGFSQAQVAAFQTTAALLPQFQKDVDAIATNSQSIGAAFAQADVGLNKLGEAWNTIKASFTDNAFWQVVTQGFTELGGILAGAVSDANKALNSLATGSWITDIGNGLKNVLSSGLGSNTQLDALLRGSGLGFTSGQLSGINNQASNSGLVQALISALGSGTNKNSPYAASLYNTFNLTVPAGAGGLTAQQIAKQLYNQFQGTQ